MSALLGEIHNALSGQFAYEVLVIDDGSTDGTWDKLRLLRSEYSQLRAWRFQYNCGKAAALALGFRKARGNTVVTLDGDLQDNPQEIPRMVALLEQGQDLVSGWKKKRHDPWHKTWPSKVFNLAVSVVARQHLHDFNCGLKAYRRAVVDNIDLYGDYHRFIPVMAIWRGFRVTETVVEHRPRLAGVSKYGVSRLLSGFLDLLSLLFLHKFAVKPVHFFGTLGLLFATMGSLVLGWFGIQWILSGALHVRPLMLLGGFSMVMGIQFASLGLLGEMVNSRLQANRTEPICDQLGEVS